MKCEGGERRDLEGDVNFCCTYPNAAITKMESMPRSLCNAVREFIERSSP